MVKVEWSCIVPGCKSNSRVPGHFFPKNVTLSCKWKEAINNDIISNVSAEELRKYRICHLHFLPENYIYSQNRRRLKYDAVPSVNISNLERVTAEIHDANITDCELQSQLETNGSDNEISSDRNEIATNNSTSAETNVLPNIENESINETVNCPSTPKTSRTILASITRQFQLTPKAQKYIRKL
ncbi:hypothetical protein DMN91_001448 [Ooceraea biroi]|uniref:THAP-type domain-containing protein n=1 Tax=Ooceraea biroi TaxID=2015173 RepID=A0A026WR93_OOCBI|nr:uncharacterized protein LOC113562163 [Ooceraea biroi]EZA58498.1 hypothetical protein X777_01093 [Ooceraea biroi]RLU27644.1 hypothetical protein DMN91_001448 [Ooceraea biroi]